MASIFDGTDALIDDWLGLRFKAKPPLYEKTTAWKKCSASETRDGCVFVRSFLCIVDKNCRDRRLPGPASKKNWRFQHAPNFVSANTGETPLERKLVRGAPNSLANQIPVASGVCSADERRNTIDLAEQCGPNEYTFFELKVGSDTPLYAAMELLGYAACYIAARRKMADLGYNAPEKQLLAATVVHLRVLAPQNYYRVGQRGYPCLRWLQAKINTGLACVHEYVEGLHMDFGFEAFPENFALESDSDTLRECLRRRVSAYPPAVP